MLTWTRDAEAREADSWKAEVELKSRCPLHAR